MNIVYYKKRNATHSHKFITAWRLYYIESSKTINEQSVLPYLLRLFTVYKTTVNPVYILKIYTNHEGYLQEKKVY